MSETLERVIADQQRKIDTLAQMAESQSKAIRTVYTQHGKLFETVGRFLDQDIPGEQGSTEWRRYRDMRHEARMAFRDAGWCFGCYNFSCECDHD